MREVNVTLYHLAELPTEKAKEKARDYIKEQIDSDDYEDTQEDCLRAARLLGFSEVELMWSGFWTQGSGACLVGTWYSCNVYAYRIQEEFPQDEKLQVIARDLEAIARKFPQLWFKTKHRGHYYHENSVDFDFDEYPEGWTYEEDLKELKRALRALMLWCYKSLEEQNIYLNSEEHVDQEAQEREYEFTADGKHWRCGPHEH